MAEEAQSEVEFHFQDCGYEDETGFIMCPGGEAGAESEEEEAESAVEFHCQACGYDDDTGFIMCPVCGGGDTGGEEGAESEKERQAEIASTEEVEGLECRIMVLEHIKRAEAEGGGGARPVENRVTSPSTSSRWPRWRRGVLQQPCDLTQHEQRIVQEAEAEESISVPCDLTQREQRIVQEWKRVRRQSNTYR